MKFICVKGQKALNLFGEKEAKLFIKYDYDTGTYKIGNKKNKKDDDIYIQILDYEYVAKLQKDFERIDIFKAAYLTDLQYLTLLIESGLYETLIQDTTYKNCVYNSETNAVYDKHGNIVFVKNNKNFKE